MVTVLLLLWCCPKSTRAASLLVVTEPWPPYVYKAEGKPTGFDYEVVAAVFEIMQIDMTIRFYPWKRCIAMVVEKKADAILDAGKTKERLEFLVYPDEPLSDSISVFFHPRSHPFTFNGMDDLTGKTVGTSLGYKYSDAFNSATHFSKEPVASIEQNFNKLLTGRVDLVIVNKNVGHYKAKEMKISDQLGYAANPVSGGPLYLAFTRQAGAGERSARFTIELRRFKQSAAYTRILERYGQ